MKDRRFYTFLHKQIPLMIGLSLLPGLGYIFLGWLHGIMAPAVFWYGLVVATSLWGFHLYRAFNYDTMSQRRLERWYRYLTHFFYLFFTLWLIIFLLYVFKEETKLHYIAIFTELGASVVASTLLSSDRRLYLPIIPLLMAPLVFYFFSIGEWYGYILSAFSTVFAGVLIYAANSTYGLLLQTSHQAMHDQLTGLYNRHFIIDYLQQFMNSLQQDGQYSYLLLLDLDHFKTINDSLGHDIGDTMLKEVARRMQQLVPANNILARLGGDEFIIIGAAYADRGKCEAMAKVLCDALLHNLKQIHIIEQHHLYISCSIGVSLISGNSINANRFIKEADIALYEVKANGRDGVFLFNETMSARVEKHLEIERLLHVALKNNEISLLFQPQYGASQSLIGAETLVRWHNQQLGDVPPDEFIPIAEQTGLIIELGNQVLEQAFITLRQWHDQGIELQQFSVNISMRQFMHHGFADKVRELVHCHLSEALRQHVIFEVTESLVAEDITRVITIMQELHALGIRFSMDDFGTGYSSLSYLKQLPIDEIKVDRSFVQQLECDKEDQAMLTTILSMARIFDLTVIAEGVETPEQLAFLQQHHCNGFQGQLFSPPLDSDGFIYHARQSMQSAAQ